MLRHPTSRSHRPANAATAALLLAATATLPTACSTDQGGIGAPVGNATDLPDGGIEVTYQTTNRPTAPDIQGTTLDGQPWDLKSHQGAVIVINVWESTCAPCRAEAPTLEQVYQDHHAQNVTFAGIDTRDDTAAGRAFAQNNGITYPSLVDSQGSITIRFQGLIPVAAVPSTVVVDRHGRIAAVFPSPVTFTALNADVAAVAAEQ